MKTNRVIKAFSLIELSITLTVVALLATAALSFSTSRDNIRKYEITNSRIKEIYKAMGIYLAKNGRLPCPAPMNTVTRSDSTYGTAAATCTAAPGSASGYWTTPWSDNNIFLGMVPVLTLGLPSEFAEDGFGTRFDYMILSGFTSSSLFGTNDNSTYIDDTVAPGNGTRFSISKKIGSSNQVEITRDAMFIILSHGANKYGGWNSNSTTQNSAPTLTEETYNYVSGSIDSPQIGKAAFYSFTHGGTTNPVIASYNDSGFDDVLFYKNRNEMVQDFALYHLLPCLSSTSETLSPGGSFTWNGSTTIYYGEASPASSGSCGATGVSKPAKRCGLMGNWETYTAVPCTS